MRLRAGGVYMALGAQQTRRTVEWPGEAAFAASGGLVAYGVQDDVPVAAWRGRKEVVIVGQHKLIIAQNFGW